MFNSVFESAIDAKGRVSVPASYRAALEGGQSIHLWPAPDREGALEGGGDALVNDMRARISRTKLTQRKRLQHIYFTRMVTLKIDDTGRVVIPPALLKLAGIEKQLVFAGADERFYIWEPDAFAAFDAEIMKATEEDLEALDDVSVDMDDEAAA